MNHTGTHAARPTAGSLLNAFLQSGKRHLILTGDRGSGKTTLLNEAVRMYQSQLNASVPECQSLPGFITYARRSTKSGIYDTPPESVQLCDRITKKTAVIGRPEEGAMQPVTEGFLGVGLDSIKRACRHGSPFVWVDEIGFLEESCPAFCDALWDLFEQKRVFAAVRGQRLPFLDRLRARNDVFFYNLSDTELFTGQVTAVVLASGESRRFGSNKLLADFCGRPMLSRISSFSQSSCVCFGALFMKFWNPNTLPYSLIPR